MTNDLASAAVVGAGLMGRWHARELARAGGSVVAVVDPDPQAAAALAGERAARFPTLTELLDATPIDVVHVCAPTEQHEALVGEALAAGVHVLVEKPLAPDAEATRRLLGTAREAGRLLCPVHQYLFQPGALRAPQALARIGPLVQVDAIACSAGGGGEEGAALDRIALDITPHALAVLQRLLPGGLSEASWSVDRPRPGELRAQGRAGGTGLSIAVSMSGRPPRNELRAVGEGGTLELDFFHGFAHLERGGASRRYKAVRPFARSLGSATAAAANLGRRAARREPAYPGLRTLIERFYEAARTGSEGPISADDTIAVARARDALAAL
jgi:predicted dehydrogenase